MTDVIDNNAADSETSHNSETHGDEIVAMPSITAEREDRAERKNKGPGSRRKMDETRGAAVPKVARNSEQMRTLAAIALLALSLVIVIGGIVYLRSELQKTQQNLLAATERVEQLEARLASTDTTMTKSEVLLSAKIKSMDGQIEVNKNDLRKLLVSVEKNNKAIQAHDIELQQQKPMLQSVTDQAKQTADQVTADSALLKNVDNAVKETVQRMELAQESINDLGSDAKTLKDKQAHFETDTAKRVTVLEDTAKSTDVFRRNTLDELRKLREELVKQTPGVGAKTAP